MTRDFNEDLYWLPAVGNGTNNDDVGVKGTTFSDSNFGELLPTRNKKVTGDKSLILADDPKGTKPKGTKFCMQFEEQVGDVSFSGKEIENYVPVLDTNGFCFGLDWDGTPLISDGPDGNVKKPKDSSLGGVYFPIPSKSNLNLLFEDGCLNSRFGNSTHTVSSFKLCPKEGEFSQVVINPHASNQRQQQKGLSGEEIAGAVAGGSLVLALGGFAAYVLRKRFIQQSNHATDSSIDPEKGEGSWRELVDLRKEKKVGEVAI